MMKCAHIWFVFEQSNSWSTPQSSLKYQLSISQRHSDLLSHRKPLSPLYDDPTTPGMYPLEEDLAKVSSVSGAGYQLPFSLYIQAHCDRLCREHSWFLQSWLLIDSWGCIMKESWEQDLQTKWQQTSACLWDLKIVSNWSKMKKTPSSNHNYSGVFEVIK